MLYLSMLPGICRVSTTCCRNSCSASPDCSPRFSSDLEMFHHCGGRPPIDGSQWRIPFCFSQSACFGYADVVQATRDVASGFHSSAMTVKDISDSGNAGTSSDSAITCSDSGKILRRMLVIEVCKYCHAFAAYISVSQVVSHFVQVCM